MAGRTGLTDCHARPGHPAFDEGRREVLSAVPRKPDEPVWNYIALRAIAELKEIPRDEIAEAVAENTRTLYGEVP